jgi:hypothetical protein
MTDITRRIVAVRGADWLPLAAAPTFALMAVVTGIADSGAHQMGCSAAMHMSTLTGMVPMYALMSVFHLTPWLRLFPAAARYLGRFPRGCSGMVPGAALRGAAATDTKSYQGGAVRFGSQSSIL